MELVVQHTLKKAELHVLRSAVEVEHCDACLVHALGEQDEIEHYAHVFGDVLWGACGWAVHIGLH